MRDDKLQIFGGLKTYSVQYYSAEVEAQWTFDDEDLHEPSLQIVYDRTVTVNGKDERSRHWLYLSDDDAIAIGNLLLAWGETQKRGFDKLKRDT